VRQVFSVQVFGVAVVFFVEVVVSLDPVFVGDLCLELFFECAAELVYQSVSDRCITWL
jgi:hypothetical protein